MLNVAAIALSALAITAAASTAFAEDRSAKVDDSRQTDTGPYAAESSVAARTDDAAISHVEGRTMSLDACREQATSAAQSCDSSQRRLVRRIDWSAVGPSTDDFASTDETLRLQGARLVATYKF